MRILCVEIFFAGIIGIICCGRMAAQDLEPRAYSASPIGADFAVFGVARSSGNVVLDPDLPFTDVNANIRYAFIGGGTTFNLFGRTALALGVVPYALADATGNVLEEATTISRSGLADSRLKFSVNFIGGRAMNVKQFSQTTHST